MMNQQSNAKADALIAKKVRMLRAAKNLSRENFAYYMGIGRLSIANWEGGISAPSPAQKEMIEAEFDAVLTEMLRADDDEATSQGCYLTCLRCLPDMSTHTLKSLNECIATLIKNRERKARGKRY